ncbi:erythromycin esterase family protein [Tundrisphaera sp. TA3]|uniref:erythromycin esterase family protein n=1 Tax=Tundrisphaera sp. TA3 TaxID=3435775 RepID=UPI003EBB6684
MNDEIGARGIIEALGRLARPLTGSPGDYDPLLERIGDARFVLIGEASHGTHEFYAERAAITRRLIVEKGFTAVAVEADWPDAYRVNRYVRGAGGDGSARESLGDFIRFPRWMWRNEVVLDFVEWLRGHNERTPPGAAKAGFYGMDLYSLRASMEAVIGYLTRVDPEAARQAIRRYSCFERFGEDPQAYGQAASFGLGRSCEDAVVGQLLALQRRAADYATRDGQVAEDEYFHAEQNARLARNAEEYYRSMFRGRASSWNLRDTHMAETLEELVAHLDRHGARTKVVVWAHNSHLGDARATEMGEGGELNVGQLVRRARPRDAVLVGFTTYDGTVTAAADWDEPARRMAVRPGLAGSYEQLFHAVGVPRFLLDLRDEEAARAVRGPLLERAIGVIYRPQTERRSHYFRARLAEQFDAVIHIDRTLPLEPLDLASELTSETPETMPTGL